MSLVSGADAYLYEENRQLKEDNLQLKADLEAHKKDIAELVQSSLALQALVKEQHETLQKYITERIPK